MTLPAWPTPGQFVEVVLVMWVVEAGALALRDLRERRRLRRAQREYITDLVRRHGTHGVVRVGISGPVQKGELVEVVLDGSGEMRARAVHPSKPSEG